MHVMCDVSCTLRGPDSEEECCALCPVPYAVCPECALWLPGMGVKEGEVQTVLESVGFGEEMQQKAISSLSGGWKMKLALGALPSPRSQEISIQGGSLGSGYSWKPERISECAFKRYIYLSFPGCARLVYVPGCPQS